jgi:Undecaprenyl-phosphate galactose phosphotransferase WbaP
MKNRQKNDPYSATIASSIETKGIKTRPRTVKTTPRSGEEVLDLVFLESLKNHVRRGARLKMGLSLLLGDLVAFSVTGGLAFGIRILFGMDWHFELAAQSLLIAVPSVIVYMLRGLYPGLGIGPTEELKYLSYTTSTVTIGVTALTFFLRNAMDFSRLTIALTWFLSLILVPVFRSLVREIGSKLEFWGCPVVIIGYGNTSQQLVRYLQKNRKIGYEPVLILNGFEETVTEFEGVPIQPATAVLNKNFSKIIGVQTAILVATDVSEQLITNIGRRMIGGFHRVIMLPNLKHFHTIDATAVDIGDMLGIRVHYNLSDPVAALFKQALDLSLGTFLFVLLSPVMFLIALLVKLDSKGSAFFRQERIGKHGRIFEILKFRTMTVDADQKLQDLLDGNSKALHEWVSIQKLTDDPRVTRLGQFLRRTSLDELPQLLNVMRGDMSLVGPRPIVREEVTRYGDRIAYYLQVKPGITGLWQVSGRTNLTYEERVDRDEFYVRNWSFWLDLTILARTIRVVIQGEGAH